MLRIYKSFIIFGLLIFLGACSNSIETKLIEFTGSTMGTSYTIKIFDDKNLISDKALLNKNIDSLLENINLQMSTYIPESEISKFNCFQDTSWFDISKDFAFVVQKSIEIGKLSNGALDITIGPLVNLWGFGPEDRPKEVPDDKLISEQMQFVGLDKISVKINNKSGRIKKRFSAIKIDLSATAKGFGVDKISEFLETKGLTNFMVEIGGEVRTKGKNDKNQFWQIGISTPSQLGGIERVLPLNSLSLATSGDYWNYFEENGKRYSHTIDPATGKPITHNLASVSVIHESCLMADGFATAIEVLGAEKGLSLANELNLPIYLIVREESGFVSKTNKKFIEQFK